VDVAGRQQRELLAGEGPFRVNRTSGLGALVSLTWWDWRVMPASRLFEHECLTPAVPVLIVGLQDADKIGHTRSITVFDHSRNLSIGRGLAPLPNPP
jgi:hypothetical protein